MRDLTSLVQDLHLKLHPLESIEVVVGQGTDDRCVAPSSALQLPFDPEESFLWRNVDLRPGGMRREKNETGNENDGEPNQPHGYHIAFQPLTLV